MNIGVAKQSTDNVAVLDSDTNSLTVTIPALLIDGADEKFRNLISLLYASVGRLQTMRRELAPKLNLSSLQLGVLMAIMHLEKSGDVRIRRVAGHLHIAAANVTSSVAELEKSGWVIKLPDPNDNRAISIKLTAGGRDCLERFARDLSIVNDKWFSGMTRADLECVSDFLERFVAQYENALFVAKALPRQAKIRSHD